MSWPPSIIIYEVSICGKDNPCAGEKAYFLSFKRARRFVEKNMKVIEETDSTYTIGGRQLWLW